MVLVDFIVHSCVKSIVKALYYFEDVTFTVVHRKVSIFEKDPLCCRSFFV